MTAAVRQLVRDGCKMHPRLGPSAWPVWSEYRPSSQLRRPAGPACNARSGYHLGKINTQRSNQQPVRGCANLLPWLHEPVPADRLHAYRIWQGRRQDRQHKQTKALDDSKKLKSACQSQKVHS